MTGYGHRDRRGQKARRRQRCVKKQKPRGLIHSGRVSPRCHLHCFRDLKTSLPNAASASASTRVQSRCSQTTFPANLRFLSPNENSLRFGLTGTPSVPRIYPLVYCFHRKKQVSSRGCIQAFCIAHAFRTIPSLESADKTAPGRLFLRA